MSFFTGRATRSFAAVLLCSLFLAACGTGEGQPIAPTTASADPLEEAAAPAQPADGDAAAEPSEPAEEEVPVAEADDPAELKLRVSAPPSINFDLSQWKLTLPSAQEVLPVELASGYQYADVFFTDRRNGGMVFRCPNIAGHTANSEYARTELREMLAPDQGTKSDANNWTSDEGGVLKATLRIDQVSTTGDARKFGRVVIGQIHDTDEPMEVVRLHYVKKPTEKTGRIYAAFESTTGGTTYSRDLVSNADGAGIALGEKFRYEIALKGRKLHIVIRRRNATNTGWVVASSYYKTIDAGYVGENLYFKAGVYNQNNTGDLADYAQATFYALAHTH